MTDIESPSQPPIVEEADAVVKRLSQVKKEINRVIYGQDKVVELSLVTLLAGGHGLLVGLPGLAKTLLVKTLGTVLALDNNRIQFTPDLLPADILGSEVLEEDDSGKRHFRFIKGPIFTQLLMADEINRASPRTQSALLQAMQEHHVTVAGNRHDMATPFHVLATQNPIEQEGTYPLPEAQLDRFLLQIDVTYPDRDAEREMMIATTGAEDKEAQRVLERGELRTFQSLVRHVPVGEAVVDAALDLVRSARPTSDDDDRILWGAGPRAAQALMLTARARALLDGRLSPSIEDIHYLAPAVLKHRMALSFSARAQGLTIDNIIAELIAPLD
ncbi:MAG: MoxR family ATPase [Sphingomonadales bacterium]|jgi:MoxR-like ATPase